MELRSGRGAMRKREKERKREGEKERKRETVKERKLSFAVATEKVPCSRLIKHQLRINCKSKLFVLYYFNKISTEDQN